MASLPIRAVEASLSFQADPPRPKAWWLELVDEIAASRGAANTLVVYMSPVRLDPDNNGLDWPTALWPQYRNPRSPNAHPETEFLPEVIARCHASGTRFYLRFVTAMLPRIAEDHPEWAQRDRQGAPASILCFDNPVGRQVIVDLTVELARRYARPDLGPAAADGFFLTILRYHPGGCTCPYTARAFVEVTGRSLLEAAPPDGPEEPIVPAFKGQRVAGVLYELSRRLRRVNPSLHLGFSPEATRLAQIRSFGCSPEHVTADASGFDFVIPQHGRYTDTNVDEASIREQMHICAATWPQMWFMLDPRPVSPKAAILARREWVPQTPQSMRRQVEVVLEERERLRHPERVTGVTFFNLTGVPDGHPNRRAVYDALALAAG